MNTNCDAKNQNPIESCSPWRYAALVITSTFDLDETFLVKSVFEFWSLGQKHVVWYHSDLWPLTSKISSVHPWVKADAPDVIKFSPCAPESGTSDGLPEHQLSQRRGFKRKQQHPRWRWRTWRLKWVWMLTADLSSDFRWRALWSLCVMSSFLSCWTTSAAASC